MTDPKTLARNTLEFLSRVDLKGSEAIVLTECIVWLNSFLQVQEETPPVQE